MEAYLLWGGGQFFSFCKGILISLFVPDLIFSFSISYWFNPFCVAL